MDILVHMEELKNKEENTSKNKFFLMAYCILHMFLSVT